jgi:hypothetical protein
MTWWMVLLACHWRVRVAGPAIGGMVLPEPVLEAISIENPLFEACIAHRICCPVSDCPPDVVRTRRGLRNISQQYARKWRMVVHLDHDQYTLSSSRLCGAQIT